jgi:hypothetical protein
MNVSTTAKPNGEDAQTLEFVYSPEVEWERTTMRPTYCARRHRIVKKTAVRVHVDHWPYPDDGSVPPIEPGKRRRTFILDRRRLEEYGQADRKGGDSWTYYTTAQGAIDSFARLRFDPRVELERLNEQLNSRYPCFTALGLDWRAGVEEIKTAYRKLSLKHHPDVGGDQNGFIRLRQVYEQALRLATRSPN